MYLIFLETRVKGLYYILPLMISIYLHSGALRKTILFLQQGRFSRSRSSKVTDAGANRERVCDFLLLRNSKLGPILHRFGDFARFCAPGPTRIPP